MKHSPLLRIWHWLNAFTVFVLLGTFFLRSTFLSSRENAQIILQKLSTQNIEVTEKISRKVAGAIMSPMWEWHIIFGYVLAVLILFRIYIFMKEGMSYKDASSLHKKGVTLLYTIFYILIVFMAISGIVLEWHGKLGIGESMEHTIKELHESVAWFFVFFVPLHIAGVVVADITDEHGLTSKMISGDKK